ncbi:hypothetical protein GCM10020216_033320 [Nonomuraea helvata]
MNMGSHREAHRARRQLVLYDSRAGRRSGKAAGRSDMVHPPKRQNRSDQGWYLTHDGIAWTE